MKGIVWYTVFEHGCDKLTEIINKYVEWYGEEIIDMVIRTKYEYKINFTNGDTWRVALATESSRGIRANISYIENNINEDIIQQIIKPCTTASPFTAYNYY
jgi:hypothetical protein